MKTIDAFNLIKEFNKVIEKIDTSMRIKEGVEQIKVAKDFFVSIDDKKIKNALVKMAECFIEESKNPTNGEETKGMFESWSMVLQQNIEGLDSILPEIEKYKESIDFFCSLKKMEVDSGIKNKNLQSGISSMIQGVKIYTEGLLSLSNVTYIFKDFVIPKMNQEELLPGSDLLEDLNLN